MTLSAFNALNSAIDARLNAPGALVSALGGTYSYHGIAPEAKSLPYVIWSYSGGGAENITPNASLNEVVYIRAYATSAKSAAELDGYIAQAMSAALTVTGWYVFWLAREDEIFLPETDEAGVTIWSCGAYYRVRLD